MRAEAPAASGRRRNTARDGQRADALACRLVGLLYFDEVSWINRHAVGAGGLHGS